MAAYAVNQVEPSNPQSMTYMENSTNAYPVGDDFNLTKGYIHTINIDEKQPSFKWSGVVGNVTGSFALIDSDGYSLYDWTITTVTGEVYATRHSALPEWESMTCASANNLSKEVRYLNHTMQWGATADEDSMNRTFTSNGADFDSFYVGQDVQVTDGASCFGTNLNFNDSHTASYVGKNWTELVLTDGNSEDDGAGESPTWRYIPKLTYVSKLQNRTQGYKNGSFYDFQMILPQNGLQGASNIAYYFYIELA
jgi:hypothetical protein